VRLQTVCNAQASSTKTTGHIYHIGGQLDGESTWAATATKSFKQLEMMKMGAGGLGTVSASSHEKACLARRPSPPPAPPSPLAQAL